MHFNDEDYYLEILNKIRDLKYYVPFVKQEKWDREFPFNSKFCAKGTNKSALVNFIFWFTREKDEFAPDEDCEKFCVLRKWTPSGKSLFFKPLISII